MQTRQAILQFQDKARKHIQRSEAEQRAKRLRTEHSDRAAESRSARPTRVDTRAWQEVEAQQV